MQQHSCERHGAAAAAATTTTTTTFRSKGHGTFACVECERETKESETLNAYEKGIESRWCKKCASLQPFYAVSGKCKQCRKGVVKRHRESMRDVKSPGCPMGIHKDVVFAGRTGGPCRECSRAYNSQQRKEQRKRKRDVVFVDCDEAFLKSLPETAKCTQGVLDLLAESPLNYDKVSSVAFALAHNALNDPRGRSDWEMRDLLASSSSSDSVNDYAKRLEEMHQKINGSLITGTWPICSSVKMRVVIKAREVTRDTLRPHLALLDSATSAASFGSFVDALTAFFEDAYVYAFNQVDSFQKERVKSQAAVIDFMRRRHVKSKEAGRWIDLETEYSAGAGAGAGENRVYSLWQNVDTWCRQLISVLRKEATAAAAAVVAK